MPLGYVSAVIATCLSAILIAVLDQHGALTRAWVIGVPLAIFANMSLTPLDFKIRGAWTEAEAFWKSGYLSEQQLAAIAVISLIWPALLPYRIVNAIVVLLFAPPKEPKRCACGAYVEVTIVSSDANIPTKCMKCHMRDAAEYRLGPPPGDT
jgi:hypothetical protein